MTNGIYIFLESIRETFLAGGSVMLSILLVGVIGFYFLYSSWMRIGNDFFRKDIGETVENLKKDLSENKTFREKTKAARRRLRRQRGFLAKEMRFALDQISNFPESFREDMEIRMLKSARYLEQGSHIIAVMASAAPLLGLLGTVTGMVATFEVITLYGNQNPALMADGISEALISTQSGLLIAFPLTLLKQRLDERIEILKEQLELGILSMENLLTLKDAS